MADQFTAEILEGRALFEELALPDTCTTQRATETRDPGGVTQTWATLAAGVACRLASLDIGVLSGQERLIAERLANESLYTLYLPALTDITAADRVVVTVSGQAARTFEVRWSSGRPSWEVFTRTLVSQVG